MELAPQYKQKILFLLSLFILAVVFSAAMPVAEAGTVMAQSEPKEKLGPGEFYPESRFGQTPAKIDLGVSSGYTARAVEEMDALEETSPQPTRSARSPAGLEFGGTTPRTHAARPPALREEASPIVAPANSTEPNSAVARKGVQEVAVIASDLGFFPKTLFVSRDVPVRLFVTSSSKNTLCIMMDSFQVRKQVRSQKIEEITFVPNVPGKYRFYCPVNGMEGLMIVKDFASTQPPQDAVSTQAAAPSRREPANYSAFEPSGSPEAHDATTRAGIRASVPETIGWSRETTNEVSN